MVNALALLELPFTFTQRAPLTASDFVKHSQIRGVPLTLAELEGFHRLGWLRPMFVVHRDLNALRRSGFRDRGVAHHIAHREPTTRYDLLEAHAAGRLRAGAEEPFMARRRRRRRAPDGHDFHSPEYVYSPYQLLSLPVLRGARPFLKFRRDADGASIVVGADVAPYWRAYACTNERQLAQLAVAVTACESRYSSAVMGTLRLGSLQDFADYDAWRATFTARDLIDWLRVEASWLANTAAGLLERADDIDPLASWIDLVREADPGRWSALRGDALIALEMRIAAELLLHPYESLAQDGHAAPLERPARRGRWSFDGRLKPAGRIDAALTKYGLSPQPRLILIVEGDTEELLLPRVMRHFNVAIRDDFISITNSEGVGRDISTLVAYAIAPRAEPEEDGRYLRLDRPLTHILVVSDAEGALTTAVQRRDQRTKTVDRIMRALPPEQRTAASKDAIRRLVHFRTWDRRGSSFEFAHFTDRELATAIAALDQRRRQPTFDQRVEHVARARATRGNLKRILGGVSKVALAEELWPVLERKVARAEARGTERRIPIVAVLDAAIDLAHAIPRSNVVIPLRGPARRRRRRSA